MLLLIDLDERPTPATGRSRAPRRRWRSCGPSVAFLDLAVRSTGEAFARRDTWVVGDDVTTDVRMGRDAGACTVLVRTGKYRLQRDLPGTPDHVIDGRSAGLPGCCGARFRRVIIR